MKLVPIPLSPLGAPQSLNIWNSELLWRYPQTPASPLADLKTQLPAQLSADPRLWNRDDVAIFLRWSEREFDLPKFDLDSFQMNGKAICLLSKADFAERCQGAGDVLHNLLHMLIRDAQMLHRHLPTSPITPTSRYPVSPHSHPSTPNWSTLTPSESAFYTNHFQQFVASNSVTLSPAPSTDSQTCSPHQQQQQQNATAKETTPLPNNTGLSQTDSDEDANIAERPKSAHFPSNSISNSAKQEDRTQPPSKPLPPPLVLEPKILNAWSLNDFHVSTPTSSPSTPLNNSNVKREFFPNTPTPNSAKSFFQTKKEFFHETPEHNTNGRLLWDFLQQLLNDPQQRYSLLISWKCRDTGVFKIVDPAGLAKLWGIQKNHLSMNYDKMSRALRYYYRVNILRKVQGERHCYQFLRNPTELKSIKNISLLRQTLANQPTRDAPQNNQHQTQQQQHQQQKSYSRQEPHQPLVPPRSPLYNGPMTSMMPNVHYTPLNEGFTPDSSSKSYVNRSDLNKLTPSSLNQINFAAIKRESFDSENDEKPTDLSTNNDRKNADSTEGSSNANNLVTSNTSSSEEKATNNDFNAASDRNNDCQQKILNLHTSDSHSRLEVPSDVPTNLTKHEINTSYY